MKKMKMQVNKNYFRNFKQDNGFVILFVVMLSSIILAITLGVINISIKEIKFGTSAKDTNDAFFAADTGAECALLHDKSEGSFFAYPAPGESMHCAGQEIKISTEENSYFWTFYIKNLGIKESGCAVVSVDKIDEEETIINSKGYNDSSYDERDRCFAKPNSTERHLELKY